MVNKEFKRLLIHKKCKSCGKKAISIFNKSYYCKNCFNVKKLEVRGINVNISKQHKGGDNYHE